MATAVGLALGSGAGAAETPTAGTRAAQATTFQVSQATVPRQSDFGGGTIYYPSSGGTFGAIAVSPGFISPQSAISWYGPALAEQGFVVFTIDTLSGFDFPASRGTQLLAALDYLTQRSTVRDRVDASRLGVMGHSMGGGGSLEAAKARPALKAAVPLTGWNTDTTWPEVGTPTLVIGADNDSIAPVASHSEPFYAGLPGTLDKAYLELNNADHFAPMVRNATIEQHVIAWFKVFLDGDTSYAPTLCPGPSPGTAVEEYRSTCPF